MRVLDDEGNLFGVVNVVDALVGLVIVALAVAGAAALVGPSEAAERMPVLITATAQVHPSVADAAGADVPPADGDVSDVRVLDVEDVNRTHAILTVEFAMDARRDDGLLYARDERLVVGRQLGLDLNRTIIDVRVTGIDQGESV